MENVKIAVALRSARIALGWNQQEFADKIHVAKSTIARIETLEMTPKADFLTLALRIFRDAGVVIDLLYSDKIVFTVESTALQEAQSRLNSEQMRRSDRKVHLQLDVAIPVMLKSKKRQDD